MPTHTRARVTFGISVVLIRDVRSGHGAIYLCVRGHLVDGILLHIANAEASTIMETQDKLVSPTKDQLRVNVLPVDFVGVPLRRDGAKKQCARV